MQNAQILAQTQRLAANCQAALTTRAVIDRAIGILMSRSGVTEDEALGRIRQISQNEHTKMTVATSIVQEAVRRTLARHTADDRCSAPEGNTPASATASKSSKSCWPQH